MWGELDRAPLTVTAPISNGPTTHGYTTMRDTTGVAARASGTAAGGMGVEPTSAGCLDE